MIETVGGWLKRYGVDRLQNLVSSRRPCVLANVMIYFILDIVSALTLCALAWK